MLCWACRFDLPRHIAGPLCSAKPELCPSNHCAPDPSNPQWWAWLKQVVAELADIFPEQFFHVSLLRLLLAASASAR